MRWLLSIVLVFWANVVMAYEEPKYDVLETRAEYELRLYPQRLVVQTSLADEDRAFGKLFRYISGANLADQKVSMTVPVTQSQPIKGVVTYQSKSNTNAELMQFYLPSQFTAQTAPVPTDPSVELAVIPKTKMAVMRFSGRSTLSNFEKHIVKLRDALQRDGIKFDDTPIRATYNGPFTPFFARRNEVMFVLK